MKKILAGGLLAICLIAASEQQASAWVNAKFGVGLNWNFSSGGNSWGWGLVRNGQPPAPEGLGGAPYGAPYGAPNFSPAPQPVPGTPMPGAATPPQGNLVPQAYQAPSTPIAASPVYYGSPYQFANFPRPAYYVPTQNYAR